MAKDLLWHGAQYEGDRLDVATIDADPMAQFRRWYKDAEATGGRNINAMTLATADAHGRVSARIVLLKELDDRGFVFFTNYESHKAEQLAANPRAALVFYWESLDRQVRIEGEVDKVDAASSEAYFDVRPLQSRIGAIASPQSRVIPSREALEVRVQEVAAVVGEHPKRPANWGGYRVIADELEFWQGQPSRLHDRIRYRRVDGGWQRDRLAP